MKAPKIYSIYNRPTSLIPHDFPEALTEQHHVDIHDFDLFCDLQNLNLCQLPEQEHMVP